MTIDEGVIKFSSDWTPGPAPRSNLVDDLRRCRRPLYKAGLIGVCEESGISYGNLSVRAGKSGRFVISGSQTGHLDDTRAEHYVLVTDYDVHGNRVSSTGCIEPSSESLTHAAIYELSDSINAIVHVHNASMWQELKHKVPTTDAAVPYGTPAMAREFARLYKETDFATDGIAVMSGHHGGIIGVGEILFQAAARILLKLARRR